MIQIAPLKSVYVWPIVLLVSVMKVVKTMMSAALTSMPHSANDRDDQMGQTNLELYNLL